MIASKPFLLLSIKRIHADRIFSRVKEFELRRTLPRNEFGTVFLYESGAAQIIGSFEPGKPINEPIQKLWKTVGERATPRERFERYFKERKDGWAIPIRSCLQFSTTLPTPKLTESLGFRPPVSSMLVRPGTSLFHVLSRKLSAEREIRRVKLSPIVKSDVHLYVELVTKEIAPKYDEISDRFARAIVKSHRLGKDPNGIFTERKHVLAISNHAGKRVGFTTLTFKVGGCVKTGPTVLLPTYRKKGYGLATRRAIDLWVRERGGRKLYCTCPDNNSTILMHLLRSGFQIEAHLKYHYSRSHGEIVLGKTLVSVSTNVQTSIVRPSIDLSRSPKSELVERCLMSYWNLNAPQIVTAFAKRVPKPGASYEEKPFRFEIFRSGAFLSGAAAFVPKRGGAVKVLWFPFDGGALGEMIEQVLAIATSMGRRKVYFVHPAEDLQAVAALREASFLVEGYIKEPYSAGRDALVMSRILEDRNQQLELDWRSSDSKGSDLTN